ncbi:MULTISPECIES: FAD binding domain-containing protein [Hydrogenophaga]|uniref:Molybdopterin dehydrogenase FAD-binding protein n=1 Tax=Hydrogenophaga intermedia TaxID=65786 RepID=A0A1L1PPI3_HYDIT|nr:MULTISPECIES: xanthine dehydrogenase family protein subunit M [Hydrogenophaga]AOS79837.1 molybdopterin dehydrogenase [Hydrogenophaga sp. PBC]TMU75552.1 xanthine dehydrogenase family protein subunit M [Hydrogenophaga intermedia]CDN87946.1 Molybdopterin dehydrogenase FAD-binding protein [Hydrogenophaga intermedia]
MKAAAFDYIKAGSIAQVIDLLVRHGDDARVLAGGQTLMATLNMRLSEPALVIDITGLQSLRGIELRGEVLRIGALATHTQIEQCALVARHAPLLAEAAPHIAHRAIRNSGTWGGSIAYADPAAEWPACLLALGGTVIVQGPDGERRIAADDFFTGLYATALRPEEIITASELPIATAGQWQGMSQLARRHGDYAIVGLAASAQRQDGGLLAPRLAFMGVGTTPWRARQAEAVLDGQTPDEATVARAVAALREEIDPLPDLTNTPDTKRHLAGVLLQRLLASARG